MKKILITTIFTIVSMIGSAYTTANFANPAAICAGVTSIPTTECETLLHFYNAMDGDNWTNNSNRGDTGNVAGWHGITLSGGSVSEIYFYANNLSGTLSSNILSGLNNLDTLSIFYAYYLDIATDAFMGLNNLEELTLYSIGISSIESGDFNGLSNLRSLTIANTPINIESGDFNGLSNLDSLSLQSTNILGIDADDFIELSNVSSITISDSPLTYIASGSFSGLSSLTSLSIQGTNISSIEYGDFTNLNHVVNFLILSDNALLTTINPYAFSGMTMSYLILNNGSINNIASGAFAGSTISELAIGNNNLSSIDINDFSNSHINIISVQDNNINSIAPGSFSTLGTININLSNNNLTSIAADTFSGAIITYLNIDSNNISTIATGAFNNAFIRNIFLNNNNLTTIENNDFSGLENSLEMLFMNDNFINTIANNTFSNFTQLYRIDINNNLLESIGSGTFNNSSLHSIYITNNRILTLASDTFVNNPGLAVVDIDNNCIDQATVSPVLMMNLANVYNYSSRVQQTCPYIVYSTTANTTGTVTATINFTGGNAIDRADVINNNQPLPSYTWTGNGSHLFNLSSLNNSSSIRFFHLTGTVTNIITAPVVGGGGGSVGGGGGGGGGGSSSMDYCPNGDRSPSYYDGSCGTASQSGSSITSGSSIISGNNAITTGNTITETVTELEEAYAYAFAHGITTMPTIQEANMMGKLTRAHLAKMLSVYAATSTSNQIDTSRTCTFPDIANQNAELQGFIKEACQRGLMGINMINFNPNGEVTRAEFGTAFSRLLFGNVHNGGNPYYSKHLQALKDEGIMNNISNPLMPELRGYVMFMMMRVDKDQ